MAEEVLSRKEKIISGILFVVFGWALLFISGISEMTLIPTSDYLLYSFIAAIPLCILIYKSDWGFIFDELGLSITTLILLTIFVMITFTSINYVFAKPTLVTTNYRIEKAYDVSVRRSNRRQTKIKIKHRDKIMSLKMYSKPLYEVQEYSHVNIQKWQGFFGYGAEIVKAMELHNNQ